MPQGEQSMVSKMKFIILLAVLIICTASVYSLPKYTENERVALEKFRHMAEPLLYREYMKTSKYLIRWLRAKDMNLQEATKMLAENVKWRQENRIDRILEETIISLDKPAFYTDGIDFTGSPVCTFIPGRIDVRKYVVGGRKHELMRYWAQFLEYGEVGIRGLANNDTSADITKATLIYDLNNYKLKDHACVPCVTAYFDFIKYYEAYYPGLCKNLVFINTPKLFHPLLELLTNVMSKETKKVFKAFADKEEWLPFLFKFIPKDQLRLEYGGTMAD